VARICSLQGSCNREGAKAFCSGNLYGTRPDTGAYERGSVFKLTRTSTGWAYSSLHDFTGGYDGCYPLTNVVFDAAGNLYSTASECGPCDFQCHRKCVRHHGERRRKRLPWRRLWRGLGNYAVTQQGKRVNAMTRIRVRSKIANLSFTGLAALLITITSHAQTLTVLHNFTNGADGALPYVGLTMDTSGNLYGAAAQGGLARGCGGNGCATIFKIDASWLRLDLCSALYLHGRRRRKHSCLARDFWP
jgi:hypothetical protein